jgi:MraZ protein
MSPEQLSPVIYAGEFSRGIDAKGRLTIPSDWCSDPGPDQFFLLPDSTEQFLLAMTQPVFAAMAKPPADRPGTQAEQMAFQRYFYSRAHRVEADKQGRLVLPEPFRARYDLAKGEVILLGAFDRFEIWNAARWENNKLEQAGNFKRMAEMRGV